MEHIVICIASLILILASARAILIDIRNTRVHNYRLKVLDRSLEEYYSLPSYNKMLHSYIFTWDLDEVVRKIRGY